MAARTPEQSNPPYPILKCRAAGRLSVKTATNIQMNRTPPKKMNIAQITSPKLQSMIESPCPKPPLFEAIE